jgi:integrase
MATKRRAPNNRRTYPTPKAVLKLPDLDQAKSAVLNSLSSIDATWIQACDRRVRRLVLFRTATIVQPHGCPEVSHAPRITESGTRNNKPATRGCPAACIYEAADCGLLSPDLAAGIRRVKGVKKLGVRLGNWLTTEQASALFQTPPEDTLKGKRDRALLAVLLACGLRRHEAVSLEMGHSQQREEHLAIIDLHGKAGHTRTVPMPHWVKAVLDQWTVAANITSGRVFRRVNKAGGAWGDGMTEKVVWHIVRE